MGQFVLPTILERPHEMYIVKFSAPIEFDSNSSNYLNIQMITKKIDGSTQTVKILHGKIPKMEQISLNELQILKNYQILGCRRIYSENTLIEEKIFTFH